ncbi:MAG: hypothetical protein Q8O11_07545 [Syntrophales bacterium]|nr:hypothetical protein [Syntrophales bacterium]
MAKALKINPHDNVAVLLEEIRSGETVEKGMPGLIGNTGPIVQ